MIFSCLDSRTAASELGMVSGKGSLSYGLYTKRGNLEVKLEPRGKEVCPMDFI